uniref:HemiSP-like protein 416 n=1 Tax=Saccoglossus kowalevskii TaxID=10224 RepID=A0A1L7H7H3_SACKO|nr:hemiSP-like protein 416 [Saccoglossus kowalevskii]
MSWITKPIKRPPPGLREFEAYDHFRFDYRSINENTLSLFHPVRARYIKDRYDESLTDAETIIFRGCLGSADTHSAVAHALWMFRVTREFGPVLAKDFADAYELTIRPREEFAGRLMDLYNNWVGRVLASDDHILDRDGVEVIERALKQGMLQTAPDPKYTKENIQSELDRIRSKIIC